MSKPQRAKLGIMDELSDTKKPSSRILTFDLMRGYFLVAIIIDHLNFFPNGLDWWSMRGGLFVTAAEGFFLISGIVLGIVRGSKLINEPMRKVTKLLLKRGFQLYVTAVVMILLFTFIGWLFYMNNPGIKPGILPSDTNIWVLLWQTFSFQYFYGWADYLRLYAIFLFISPLVFWLLRKGKWYIVALMSFLVWLTFPNDPSVAPGVQEYLQPLSWQVLFFGGVMIGFYWPRIVKIWNNFKQPIKRFAVISLLSLAVVTMFINILIMLSTMGFNFNAIGINPQLQHDLYVNFFDKERMPLARILLALTWFWAGFYIFKKFEKPIVKVIGWLIIPFGMNSLYVYTLHAVAVYFVDLYLTGGKLWWNFIVVASVILAIRLCIHYKVLMRVIPR